MAESTTVIYLPVRPRPRKRAEESTNQLRHSPRRKWECEGMSWLRNPLPSLPKSVQEKITNADGAGDHGNVVCPAFTFPFGQKIWGLWLWRRRHRMLLLSLVTHIPQSAKGERGCRSTTTTTFLPLWGAEIGQWLGKHVALPLPLSLFI